MTAPAPNIAVRLVQVSKQYRLYASPGDRLKEALHPLRRKRHSVHHALQALDLEVAAGQTLGILGRNGAGKSTLLKLITGVLTPTSGTVETRGRIASLLELGAGFNPELTGRENIAFAGAIMGYTASEVQAREAEIIAFAEIGEYIDQPVRTYSSGMYARLAFAVATCVDPDIFIVDEALAVGDAAFVHRCMLRFHDMQKAGKTILLVTHDATMVKQLCHRALWLEDGKAVMCGDPMDVSDAYLRKIHMQQDIPLDTSRAAADKKSSPARGRPDSAETDIPNCDKRIGNQDCTILGIGLYNQHGEPARDYHPGDSMLVRVSFRSNVHSASRRFIAGFVLHNQRGQDIASSNSQIAKADFPAVNKGDVITVAFEMSTPQFQRGNYSITVSISQADDSAGGFVTMDKIYNALHFAIHTPENFHTPLLVSGKYSFRMESESEQSQ